MKAGDVVRWTFVQGDGQRKMRPAIVISAVPPFNDWLVCAVSTQLHRAVKDLDVLVDTDHPDFERAGLRVPSLVRVAQLSTLPDKVIQGPSVRYHRQRLH
ncbi:MAG: type II toxin-antitoxin system PemK/MazF family toxin [Flavobacteriales bacterium]|nr:type II toxin-antitoxin system PemK/MazF family toxin [Flavobacteriales bacterium]